MHFHCLFILLCEPLRLHSIYYLKKIVEKIKGDVISKIWLVVKNTSNSYKKEIEKDIEGKKMELLLMKREQLIMQIEMNRNNILDYQTMIDEVLKGSQS